VSRFRGTAWHYARYRKPYPPELFELLRTRFALDRVLDVAAGTGLSALPLAEWAGEVVALDVEPELLAELTAVAPANVTTAVRRAEEIDESLGAFTLATIARAFHWLERDEVLRRLHRISPGLAIFGSGAPSGEPWDAVAELAARHVGDRRPTYSGEAWAEVVERSPYRRCDELELEADWHWTADEVVGHTLSLSWASPALLGDRLDVFVAELRAAIGPGPWIEHVRFEVLLSGGRDE
jgi:SAM-dependent methyltransferase